MNSKVRQFMKLATAFVSAAVLTLSGCASMTPESVAAFSNAMGGLSDSMQKSNEATQRSMDSFNSRPKNQSCYNDGFGGVRCYTY